MLTEFVPVEPWPSKSISLEELQKLRDLRILSRCGETLPGREFAYETGCGDLSFIDGSDIR